MPAPFEPTDDRVVVVIGSGAGGGTVQDVLCEAGIDVVLLEAGERHEPEDYVRDEWTGYRMFSWSEPRIASGTWRHATDHPRSPVWHCMAVGGSTQHWLGVSLRFAGHEFRARSVYGDVPGASLADWPFGLETLAPYYDRAEARMGVSGTGGRPDLPVTNNYKVFHHGARRAGYRGVSRGRLAINAVPYDGRPASIQDGFTLQGDRARAKWCTATVEIPRALATGRLDLRPGCRAIEIEVGDDDRARAVVYVDPDGVKRRQACRLVILAGNAIESPRLLLASANGRHPDGIANGSGHVGRHYMRHVMGTVWSVFERPVRHHIGESMPGLVADEARHDPRRGFVGGYYVELNAISLPALAVLLDPGAWGAGLAWTLERYANIAGMIAVGEDMPRPENRVTLEPGETDAFGVPLARVHMDEHPNDTAMRSHAYGAMRRIHEAAGAVRVHEAPPFPATHNMGTLRMSEDPADGVVDPFGRAHGIDNLYVCDGSVFPTSGAANPTLTIVALAVRQGEHLVGRIRRGEV